MPKKKLAAMLILVCLAVLGIISAATAADSLPSVTVEIRGVERHEQGFTVKAVSTPSLLPDHEDPEADLSPQEAERTVHQTETFTLEDMGLEFAPERAYRVAVTQTGQDSGFFTDAPEWTVTFTTDAEGSPQGVQVLRDGQEAQTGVLRFENVYIQPAKASLSASMAFAGDARPAEPAFTARLSSEDIPGFEGETLTMTGEAPSESREITFTEAGDYHLALALEGEPPHGYTKDPTVYSIAFKVSEDPESHALQAGEPQITAAGSPRDALRFSSTYTPDPASFTPGASVSVSGAERPAESLFKVLLSGEGEDQEKSVTGSGDAVFDAIPIAHAGEHTFTITQEDLGATGYTYDSEVWTVKTTVIDTDGRLSATAGVYERRGGSSARTALFENTYNPVDAEFSPRVMKRIGGSMPPSDETFSFTLSGTDSARMTMPKNTSATVRGEDQASFEPVRIHRAGTYTVRIAEDRENAPAGYRMDTRTYTVSVSAYDDAGVLRIQGYSYRRSDGETSPAEGYAVFENTYEPVQTTYAPVIEKTVSGQEPEHDTVFHFEIAQEDGPGGTILPSAASVTGAGQARTGVITFTRAGDYRFRITELNQEQDGWAYDGSQWILSLTVEDRGGNLAVRESGVRYTCGSRSESKAVFENTYNPQAVTATLSVEHRITGGPPAASPFSFVLSGEDQDGAVLPRVREASVNGEGTADFPGIQFEKAGDYRFEIRRSGTPAHGYTTDSPVWHATVKVADDRGRLMVESVSYEKDGQASPAALFESVYAPDPTPSVVITGEKRIEGAEPASPENFRFRAALTDGSPDDVVRSGETASVDGAGAFSFPGISFGRAGTYRFDVSEEQGDAPGYTYDARTVRVEVEVSDHAGYLQADRITADGEEGPAVFINSYSDPNATGKLVLNNTNPTDTAYTLRFTKGASELPGPFPYSGAVDGEVASGGRIVLHAGESVTIEDLPADAGYEVRTAHEGLTETFSGTIYGGGTVEIGNGDQIGSTGNLHIINSTTGQLSYRCSAESPGGRVLETALGLSGSLSGSVATGDEFALAPAQEVTVSGIPDGYTFILTQTDMDGFKTVYTGTVRGGRSVTPADGEAVRYGKVRASNAGTASAQYTFSFSTGRGAVYPVTGDIESSVADGGGFVLMPAASATVEDIPEGTHYRIRCRDGQGYYRTWEGEISRLTDLASAEPLEETGVLASANTETSPVSYTVSATVDGEPVGRDFLLTGDRTGALASGSGYTLSPGEQVHIEDVPEGAEYEVTEDDNNGSSRTHTGTVGPLETIPVDASNVSSQTGALSIRNSGAGNTRYLIRLASPDGEPLEGDFAVSGSVEQEIESGSELTLHPGESALVERIPENSRFSVDATDSELRRETRSGRIAGWAVTALSDSALDEATGNITFQNHSAGPMRYEILSIEGSASEPALAGDGDIPAGTPAAGTAFTLPSAGTATMTGLSDRARVRIAETDREGHRWELLYTVAAGAVLTRSDALLEASWGTLLLENNTDAAKTCLLRFFTSDGQESKDAFTLTIGGENREIRSGESFELPPSSQAHVSGLADGMRADSEITDAQGYIQSGSARITGGETATLDGSAVTGETGNLNIENTYPDEGTFTLSLTSAAGAPMTDPLAAGAREITPGEAFSLASGESLTLTGIPDGARWSLEAVSVSGVSQALEGTVQGLQTSDTATGERVSATGALSFTAPRSGKLIVSLTGEDIPGSFPLRTGGAEGRYAPGASIDLSSGQTAVICQIPEGTAWQALFTDSEGIEERHSGETAALEVSEIGEETRESVSANLLIANTTGQAASYAFEIESAAGSAPGQAFTYTGSKSGTIQSGGALTLADGESVTVVQIPEGTVFRVKATLADHTVRNYEITPEAGKASELESGAVQDGEALLSVSNRREERRSYTFTLTGPSGEALSDAYAYTGAASGVLADGSSLDLDPGAEISVAGIPGGSAYSIREADADGNWAVYEGYIDQTGAVRATDEGNITSSAGSLTLTGSFEGGTLTIDIAGAGSLRFEAGASKTVASGDTVELSSGQEAFIRDIPGGASYLLTETAPDGSEKIYSGTAEGGVTASARLESENITGRGALRISKEVEGSGTDESFAFTVTLTGPTGRDLDGEFEVTGDGSGKIRSGGEISLAGGESATIADIPAGTLYTVTEEEVEGCLPSAEGDAGTIGEDAASECRFVNTFEAPEAAEGALVLNKYQSAGGGARTQESVEAEKGEIIAYTLEAVNNSDAEVKGIVLTDTVPAGTELAEGSSDATGSADGTLTWTAGNLAPGESFEGHFSVTATGEGSVENRFAATADGIREAESNTVLATAPAGASPDEGESPDEGQQDGGDEDILPDGTDGSQDGDTGQDQEDPDTFSADDLTVTKSHEVEDYPAAAALADTSAASRETSAAPATGTGGCEYYQTVTYRITVKNNSDAESGPVTLNDRLDARLSYDGAATGGPEPEFNTGNGTLIWEIESIAPGGEVTVEFDAYPVPAGLSNHESLENCDPEEADATAATGSVTIPNSANAETEDGEWVNSNEDLLTVTAASGQSVVRTSQTDTQNSSGTGSGSSSGQSSGTGNSSAGKTASETPHTGDESRTLASLAWILIGFTGITGCCAFRLRRRGRF